MRKKAEARYNAQRRVQIQIPIPQKFKLRGVLGVVASYLDLLIGRQIGNA